MKTESTQGTYLTRCLDIVSLIDRKPFQLQQTSYNSSKMMKVSERRDVLGICQKLMVLILLQPIMDDLVFKVLQTRAHRDTSEFA